MILIAFFYLLIKLKKKNDDVDKKRKNREEIENNSSKFDFNHSKKINSSIKQRPFSEIYTSCNKSKVITHYKSENDCKNIDTIKKEKTVYFSAIDLKD